MTTKYATQQLELNDRRSKVNLHLAVAAEDKNESQAAGTFRRFIKSVGRGFSKIFSQSDMDLEYWRRIEFKREHNRPNEAPRVHIGRWM